MPRNPKGEMSLSEIRNLARQHNKLSTITGIDTSTRANLIAQIERMGYQVNHELKKIVVRKQTSIERKKKQVKVAPSGERKKQQKTVAKERRQAFAKTEKPKVNLKTGRAKPAPPPIAPALAKQRKAKAKSKKDRALLRASSAAPYK